MAYSTVNTDFMLRPGNYNVGKDILDEEITLTRYFNCATDNLASGAFYKIFAVPANFLLTDCFVTCQTVEGAADTIDVVDDDSATTTFVSNADLNTANAVTATNARKLYAAAGFIVLRPDAALTAAKFYVTVRGYIVNTSM